MVIGNGLIANAFKQTFQENQDILFFASGVSNSNEDRLTEFEREKKLLLESLEIYKNKIFIYFSSCDIQSTDHSLYFSHKINMENLVKTKATHYYIFRLPQVVGKAKNTNTLTNFLYSKIQNDLEFVVWKNARRNLIDVDDVESIVNHIIFKNFNINSTINIASSVDYSVADIVNALEKIINKKAKYALIDKGSNLRIDTTHLTDLFLNLNIKFSKSYLDKIINKYYKLN